VTGFGDLVTWLESSPWLWCGVLLVFGTLFGSFLNVVILRLPERLAWVYRREMLEELGGAAVAGVPSEVLVGCPPGIVYERSHCPKCGHVLAWWENIPVLSWCLLRGRCRSCGTWISFQYPLVELLVGVLFLVCGWMSFRGGFSVFGIETFGALVLTGFLVALSGIDLRTKWLLDEVTLPLLWLGLVFSLSYGSLFWDSGQVLVSRGGMGISSLESSVLGAVLGYGVLWLMATGFRLLTGREGMGHGDFKLLAALGAWVGAAGVLPIVLFGSVLGAVFGLIWRRLRDGDEEFPFGPSLALSGWWVYVFGVPEVLKVG